MTAGESGSIICQAKQEAMHGALRVLGKQRAGSAEQHRPERVGQFRSRNTRLPECHSVVVCACGNS